MLLAACQNINLVVSEVNYEGFDTSHHPILSLAEINDVGTPRAAQ